MVNTFCECKICTSKCIYTVCKNVHLNRFCFTVNVLVQTPCNSVPCCSIATDSPAHVCDRSAPVAVRALKLGPRSAAVSGLGFHVSWGSSQTQNWAFLAALGRPAPFSLLPCGSPFLCIPLHSSPSLPASLPDPPCCQRRSSH